MSKRDVIARAILDLNPSAAHWEDQYPSVQLHKLEEADAILSALTAAGYAVERGWQPIETAPRDRLVEVYAPSPDPARWTPEVHDLPPIVCLARWHPDAGFCVCEIREVTHWREHVPPAGEATP